MPTLPAGWTGNNSVHHRNVGSFRVTVRHQQAGITGSSYGYRVEYRGDRQEFLAVGVYEPVQNIHRDAATARDAAMAYLRKLATDILTGLI